MAAPQPLIGMSSYILIFANGSVRRGAFVQQAIDAVESPLIVAADGGARMAVESFGLTPDVILGDLDSLSTGEVAAFEAQGAEVKPYPPEKNETDLEIALKWAVERGATTIRVVGALGRRIDQTFGNVYLLALPELQGIDIRLVSGDQQIWLVQPGTHVIDGVPGDTLSLLPITMDVTDIHTENLYYPLIGDTLHFGPARGISNVLTTEQATVTFGTGLLLIVHTRGRAE